MKNKKIKGKSNIINSNIKVIVINNNNQEKEKLNQDLIFTEYNYKNNNDKIDSKYNNTISYTDNEINKDLIDEKSRNINLNKYEIKDSFSQDKFIQTPSTFYSFSNLEKINNNCYTPNQRILNKEIYKINKRYTNFEKKLNIPRINSSIRPPHFSNKFEIIKNIKHSRNKKYQIMKNNKFKTNEKETKNFYLLKEYFNNNIIKKRKNHHNLLTIENIYFQGRKIYNNSQVKHEVSFLNKNKKYDLTLFKKKYSVKEIKYPYHNNIQKQYKIVNDNNPHLLEEIFKKQTLSNFNNKYTLKYKTNSSVKKENVMILFSLLKKYKNSDEDKQTAFDKYNSIKNIKKI